MLVAKYSTKKSLRESVGERLRHQETSMFASEYKRDGTFEVVGPEAYKRNWYAVVTMENGRIKEVE